MIVYMWNLKKYTNELIYKIEIVTNVENKLMVTKRRSGGGINWENGIDIYILLQLIFLALLKLAHFWPNHISSHFPTVSFCSIGRAHV